MSMVVHASGCAPTLLYVLLYGLDTYASRQLSLFHPDLGGLGMYADGPLRSLVELSLAGGHRRGHGSVYAALARRTVRQRSEAHGCEHALRQAVAPLPRLSHSG
jgi:hypothetical protein